MSSPHIPPAAGPGNQSQRVPRVLDDTDKAIIEQLQGDGRAPYTKLGAAVGLSEAAVRQRVSRLIDSGVIQVVAVTNPLLVGRRRVAMIGVRTQGPTSPVSAALQELDEVAYLVVTAGSFDILCEVVVADDAHLLEVVNTIRALTGVVATETFMYLSLEKQTYEWGAR
jgi:Lrp/AsnC family transcriptional regulator for asnA, asnC and gidA